MLVAEYHFRVAGASNCWPGRCRLRSVRKVRIVNFVLDRRAASFIRGHCNEKRPPINLPSRPELGVSPTQLGTDALVVHDSGPSWRLLQDLLQRHEVLFEEVFVLEVSFEEPKRTVFRNGSNQIQHHSLHNMRLWLGSEPVAENIAQASLLLRKLVTEFGLQLRNVLERVQLGSNIGLDFPQEKQALATILNQMRQCCQTTGELLGTKAPEKSD